MKPAARPEFVKAPAAAPPPPIAAKDAFSDLEMAFFEEDLQKVEEVDTFEDLVADEPEPEGPWGRLFGRPKKPTNGSEDEKPSKTLPRPPDKRK